MFLQKKKRASVYVLSALLLMSACKSASFPEITDDYAETSDNGILKESAVLASDNKYVAYDDEVQAEEVTPAKTKPVIVSDSQDLDKEESILSENIEDMNISETDESVKISQEAKPSVPVLQIPQIPSVTYLVETFYFERIKDDRSGYRYRN